MKYFITTILFLTLIGCSPQKRLNRLVKKHPELVQQDTITHRDTIITEHTKVDTVFKDSVFFRLLRDTIRIHYNNVRVTQYHTSDTIRIEAECLSDTIYYEKRIPIDVIRPVTETKIPNYMWLIVGGLIILCILTVRKL